MTTGSTTGDFEEAYSALVKSSGIDSISRQVANSLVDRMLQGKESTQTSDITKRIAEAAATGDTDLIFSLTDELKKIKDKEQERTTKLREMASSFTFTELLRAFPSDYREMVHELATLVIQTSEKGLAERKKRSRTGSQNAQKRGQNGPAVYVIRWKGSSIEVIRQQGAARLPGAEKEFFEFMGFEVAPDGRSVEPTTFENKDGQTITASKNAIISDLLADNPKWKDQGFTIELKKQAVEQAA